MLGRPVGNRFGSVVMIAAGSRAVWVWIAVRDQGPGIAEGERKGVSVIASGA